ncbi:MAG: aldehyde dehydrogenase (NADP(+)) [Desulfobacterales bacterium]|nr:aldehyde dehydrogenase (NADP(+)) [Desulfobacterales bacterium]
MDVAPVLVNGKWQKSESMGTFRAINPATQESLPVSYPVSSWYEIKKAITAGFNAAEKIAALQKETIAEFLENYALRIEKREDEIVAAAHIETALPSLPRLKEIELPRTINQLQIAAKAVRDRSWSRPTIDTATNIRSMYEPLGGPVIVFGPNNFPFAFNSVSGGDMAAAVAAGNTVIAKANTGHPATTRILAEEALKASLESGMPAASIQMIYRTDHADGKKMVSHRLVSAVAYTGSRSAGLELKEAAEKAGKPIYLELSSVNPVFFLPGAVAEKGPALAEEFVSSCLLGVGQFCTNPGIGVIVKGTDADNFVQKVVELFEAAPVGTLLGPKVYEGLLGAFVHLKAHGASLVTGGKSACSSGYCIKNTLFSVSGDGFIADPVGLQKEAFGNATLLVIAKNESQLPEIAASFEGNLTGSIYSHTEDRDERLYKVIQTILRKKVGRLLNDKMPTGVEVVPSMNHGGPFPAAGHPGFTAVGIPGSILRFAQLCCYDNIRHHRLPPELQDKNLTGSMWRLIDGAYTQEDI